ncbi:PucR family transcriptional regulator [Dethiosulfovibrio salsuginis]|uniref:PucR C-terminal helix-turn-helix domain-containing protein n=1 Tax=Dethiosulfovibrio salsuginis TaxID=561720 RepID=A0A1X7KC87_9BACT|nr:helix-turn-helix domain-containing protein [Dethiosulfovibrio salsuginis]SMG38007.1 PucR C-terminal helix-turn-helix domain-containing protein [Dethiosulfovibrio salsuginis]
MELIQDRKGTEDILEAMRGFLQNVAFWDSITGNVHVASRSKRFIAQVRQMPLHELVAIYPHGTVEEGGEKLGYVLYYHGEELDRTTGEEALAFGLTALRVSLGGRRHLIQENQQVKEEVVRGLVAGNKKLAERAIRKAGSMGWQMSGAVAAVVAEHTGVGDLSGAIGLLSGWFRSRRPGGIQGTVNDDLVLIVPAEDPGWKGKLEQELMDYVGLSKSKVPFMIGVGSEVAPMDLGVSYSQAREATEMGQRIGRSVAFWEDMEVLGILSSVPWTDRTRGFIERRLGAIKSEKDGEPLRSLRALVRRSWNLKAAAADLSIHYNTMRYRYEKLLSATGLDDDNPWARIGLGLAVLLDEVSEDMGRK